MYPLQHLDVLLDLLGLLFAAHDVVQGAVVTGGGAGCEGAGALGAGVGDVLGGGDEGLAGCRTCGPIVLELGHHVAVHSFLQIMFVYLDIAHIDQALAAVEGL